MVEVINSNNTEHVNFNYHAKKKIKSLMVFNSKGLWMKISHSKISKACNPFFLDLVRCNRLNVANL